MTTTGWESELRSLLDELGEVQEQLLALLTRKRRCLAAGDWSQLETTQPQEQALLERLERCHARRQQLLEHARREAPYVRNLKQLAAWAVPNRAAESQQEIQQLSGRLRLLQHESLTNWVIAQRSLLHLTQLLEVLASGGRLQPTYGRPTLPLSQGTIVDQEI